MVAIQTVDGPGKADLQTSNRDACRYGRTGARLPVAGYVNESLDGVR